MLDNSSYLNELGHSEMVKVSLVGLLAILLMIPLSFVSDLIKERQYRSMDVIRSIQEQWGPEVKIRGPILVVPIKNTTEYHYILPEQTNVKFTSKVTERYRGIYKLPTFLGTAQVSGIVQLPTSTSAWAASNIDKEHQWDLASWVMLLDTPKQRINIHHINNNKRSRYYPNKANLGIDSWFMHTKAHVDPQRGTASFNLEVSYLGTNGVSYAPLANEAHLSYQADWPHPSFEGDILATQRQVDSTGFSAQWDLTGIQTGHLVSTTATNIPKEYINAPNMGIRFVEAVSHYLKVTRAVKHAILVILLTFSVFFCLDLLLKLNIHPIQYILIGFALVTFYLLLLSLAEHISFTLSYTISTAAVVALVGSYSRAVLISDLRAIMAVLGLSCMYGLLYIILQAEQFALLAGAWAIFAVLALIMYLTRQMNNKQEAQTLENPSM